MSAPDPSMPPPIITAPEVRQAARLLATAAGALALLADAGEGGDTHGVLKAWGIAQPALLGVGELVGITPPEGNYPRLATALARALWPPG